MSITGSLTDFSIPEIFQFIDKGQKTGLLTLRPLSENQAKTSAHYLWFKQGRVVAAANQLNEKGLVSLIHQYPWVSQRVVNKLVQFCPANKPLGWYLKNQGALKVEHLEHLFQIQMIQQLCPVFLLKDAHFVFDFNVPMSTLEMTGLSVSANVLGGVWQKLVMLRRLLELRRFKQEGTRGLIYPENFCKQLNLILDIAFFHSLNLSLFDPDNRLTKLYQIIELYDRPYDLPKSIKPECLRVLSFEF
jgi:hypothetical protein